MRHIITLLLIAFLVSCSHKPKQRTIGYRIVVHILPSFERPAIYQYYAIGDIPGDTMRIDTINMSIENFSSFMHNYDSSKNVNDPLEEIMQKEDTLISRIYDTVLMKKIKIYNDSVRDIRQTLYMISDSSIRVGAININ